MTRLRPNLPPTAWSPPFVLILVVAIVQIYLLIFLRLVSLPALQGDFLAYQWLYEFFTAGGSLARGLPFELMKVNVLLAVYLWAMSRTMDPRREAVQRLGLVGAAVVLVVLQLAWVRSYDVIRPSFDLMPVSLCSDSVGEPGTRSSGSESRPSHSSAAAVSEGKAPASPSPTFSPGQVAQPSRLGRLAGRAGFPEASGCL